MRVKLLSDMLIVVKLFDTADKELRREPFFKGGAPDTAFINRQSLCEECKHSALIKATDVYLYQFELALIFK